MKLTKIERLLLTNQMLILEKLYPEDARYYARHRTALQEGYAIHYKDLFQHIDDDELLEEACREARCFWRCTGPSRSRRVT